MFILRSAFWLTIGFLLVAPHGTDFGKAAAGLRDQAVETGISVGTQIVVSQVQAGTTLPALLELAAPPDTESANTLSQAGFPALPRPRPAALG